MWKRLFVAIVLSTASPGCSDSSLPVDQENLGSLSIDQDDPGEEVLTLTFVTNGCAAPGVLASAVVRRVDESAYYLSGTIFVEGDSLNCFEPRRKNDDCVVETELPMKVLDAAAIARLHDLMSDVRVGTSVASPICDSCAHVAFHFLGRAEVIDPCSRDANQLELSTLHQFIANLFHQDE